MVEAAFVQFQQQTITLNLAFTADRKNYRLGNKTSSRLLAHIQPPQPAMGGSSTGRARCYPFKPVT
ncbi:MAG TPA: hypothetical protein VK211_12335 [Kamptonema sp.]|nr:hypothetical protein [Kamptonema sp.]